MYLSRVLLDTNSRGVMRALHSPSKIHGAIENSFEGERQRNLWRLDNLNGNLYLLLLSGEKPDLTEFCKQFGTESTWETKDYDVLVNRIQNDMHLRFRLTANPTVSVYDKEGKRGRVCAHITSGYQKKWLVEKGEKNGFLLDVDEFDITQSKWNKFYKSDNRTVSILSVTYEGILTVKDAELFKNALLCGIGRGKAYGMGLMTVIG